MSSSRRGKGPHCRRCRFILLPIALLGVGGCAVSEDLLDLFAYGGTQSPLCGIFFDCTPDGASKSGKRDGNQARIAKKSGLSTGSPIGDPGLSPDPGVPGD
jgi:hypothetical protein